MHRVLPILLLLYIVPVSLFSQLSQLHIAGKPERMTAPIPEVRDINGRICAALQFISAMEGFKYDSYNGVVKMIDTRGKDLIFVSPDERVVQIYHSGYQPLTIILAEYGIRLSSQHGWEIKLTAEKIVTQMPVVINTYPDSVNVTINDNDYGVGKVFMLANGSHKIQLSKLGFAAITDSITVDKQHSQFEFVLAPKLELVFVKGGSFRMGDTFGDGDDDEKPVHKVTVNDFYISKYEVTFAAYDAFCEQTGKVKPDDEGWGRGKRPVINVSWYDAVQFCNYLSRKNGFTPCYRIDKRKKDPNNKSGYDDLKWTVTRAFNANGYRLPTEAEWEYACRGGSRSAHYKYSGSNNVDEVAWYSSNSGSKTHKVGTKKPNELGLYDMSGNVWEWCADWYDNDYYSKSKKQNPEGPASGSSRVLRGGSWHDEASGCRVANRLRFDPVFGLNYIGFRVVQDSPQ